MAGEGRKLVGLEDAALWMGEGKVEREMRTRETWGIYKKDPLAG